MKETGLRRKTILALRDQDAIAVENGTVGPGTPDVNYVGGWIELKVLSQWPRNADVSPVLVPLYTPQQRIWARRRARRGGTVWFFLQVGNDYLLFDGAVAADIVGLSTKQQLIANTMAMWRKFDAADFRKFILQNGRGRG